MKPLSKLLDRLRGQAGDDGSALRAVFQLFHRFLFSSTATTSAAPHIRDSNSVQRVFNTFVIATLPCWLIGAWNTGQQINVAMEAFGVTAAPGWRGSILAIFGVGYDPFSIGACLFHGLTYFVPIFIVALLTGTLWEVAFAQGRRRPVDDGLLYVAWLFTLILPASVPLYQVVLGMTFGMVVGKGIYGGTGRYLVNPAVLGIAFLVFSYSNLLFGEGAWVPVAGYDEPTTIALSVQEGGVPALLSVGYDWWHMFLGNQPGPLGVTSILGCLLGAAYLLFRGAASWRIMAGSFAGFVGTVILFNQLGPADSPAFSIPWNWHLVMGGWAFGTVFLATDPVAASTTNPGRWGFGILVGALTVVVRITNPSYFEGVLFAILLASIFSPLIDYVVVQRNIKRRRMRLAADT